MIVVTGEHENGYREYPSGYPRAKLRSVDGRLRESFSRSSSKLRGHFYLTRTPHCHCATNDERTMNVEATWNVGMSMELGRRPERKHLRA